MADVSARTPVFSRGSTVLDYWLAHAEGLTVQPLGARVEHVIVKAPVGHAEALIVRSRMTRRRRAIPAESIAAVEPSRGHLLLDAAALGTGPRIPRPSPERIAAARVTASHGGRVAAAQAAGAARSTRAGTMSALSWLHPRAERAGAMLARSSRIAAAASARYSRFAAAASARYSRIAAAQTARYTRIAAAQTARGLAWLAPRVAAGARTAGATGARLALAAAVIVARGVARAARELERAAASAAASWKASVEARRVRQQRNTDERGSG